MLGHGIMAYGHTGATGVLTMSVSSSQQRSTREPPADSPYVGRVGLEEMEAMRRTMDPNAFSAPLNQGSLSRLDKFNLFFLIAFPLFFFVLGIILTAALG
ncbi:unnamed protein product [Lymnaea stagnalis]|uniref:Uncharacterized protein n=1 Tax=Lymnaea stagnalis TaxID=6523 RepID=A0AAV2IK44_LYMST